MKTILPVLLLASCIASPNEPGMDPNIKIAFELARGIGDAVLRQKGAAELKRFVPELLPLIDAAPKDGLVTLDEVEVFIGTAAADPKSIALLVATLVLLRKEY